MLAERHVHGKKQNRGQLYELLLSDRFEMLEFYLGGQPGPNHRILFQPLLDGSCLVQYAGAEYGRMPEYDESIFTDDPDAPYYGKLIFLDRPSWRRLARMLDNCEILHWDHRYIDGDIDNGRQWYLDVSIRGQRRICRAGYNAYPPPWERYIRLLQQEIDPRIG